MKLYGLTGGIASGKSTVARQLRDLGAVVIDADQLAREVVRPGRPAHAEILAAWPQVAASDGTIDRKKLGELVFADAAQRTRLEAMTHPRIAEESARLATQAAESGAPLAFYEAALLVETGSYRDMDGLVVVTLPREEQLLRLQARDGISPVAARARLAAQLPLDSKAAVADHVIDNSGSPAQTQAAVAALYERLIAASAE